MMFLLVTTFSNNKIMASAENEVIVQASLGRYWIYDSNDYFEDSVSGVVSGYLRSRYDISPEGEVDIYSAKIELVTPFEQGDFHDIYPLITPVLDGSNWKYTWDFGVLSDGQGAMVSLPTNFQVNFNPGFDCQRIWNPWITSEFVTQTLTIVFTPSTDFYDFHGVHVSVQIPSTSEASLISLDGISALPINDQNGDAWNTWADFANGEVNWQGDPEPGITYYFSVDVTMQNNLDPEPIFFKPSVGVGANYDGSFSSPDSPNPIIEDNIDRDDIVESFVTYYGEGVFDWREYVQSENVVSLPWCSFGFHEIYSMSEGRALVKSGDGLFRGSAHLRINKKQDTVRLSDPNHEHVFWWAITECQSLGAGIILKCIPTDAGTGDDPGPEPIKVKITRFQEGGRVAAFGKGVQFAGQIVGIEWPTA